MDLFTGMVLVILVGAAWALSRTVGPERPRADGCHGTQGTALMHFASEIWSGPILT